MAGTPRKALLGAIVATLLAVGAAVAPTSPASTGPVVSVGDQSGLERDVAFGSVFMPVYLSEPASEPVVVNYYTVNGTAIYIPPEDRDDPWEFGDYQRRGTPEEPRSITIPAGALQGSINVGINVDDEVEDDETFFVVLHSVEGANATIGRDTGTATIVDADGLAGPNPVITVSNPTVVEGDVGQRRAQFQIHLSRAPETNVTISYTTQDGTAVAGEDYMPRLPGSVTFLPGQISKTVDVLVNSDTVVNGDRQFTLEVSVIGGSPVEEISLSGVATILDDDSTAPLAVTPTVVAGGDFTCQLDASGTVRCWGGNNLGQFGNGTTTGSLTPVVISQLTDVVQLTVGNAHACALNSDGGVQCWGDNANNQLGNPSAPTFDPSFNPIPNPNPVQVEGLTTGVVSLDAGDNHTCAVLADGEVRCWGRGTNGQLGNGATVSSNTPVTVSGLADAVEVAGGSFHTCARLADGSMHCWGRNDAGQLGLGFTSPASPAAAVNVPNASPVVGISSGATSIAASGQHTCVVQNGGARCFGLNSAGQLGNGLSGGGQNQNVPVDVTGLTTGVAEVAVGGIHSCAITDDGAMSCWGINEFGQLGNGTSGAEAASSVPVAVTGLTSGQTAAAAGPLHTCALDDAGAVRCWGRNQNGQVGSGTLSDSSVPVLVVPAP